MVLLTSAGYEETWKRHKAELEGRISGRIADSGIEVSSYSTNAGNFEVSPVAVIAPADVQDVIEVVQFCRTYSMPLTARGAGSSVTDAALGHGIILDFSRNMNSILALDIANDLVTVGAGTTISALNEELKKYGKMIPLFPVKGLNCTVGGCIATDAGGFLATGYGRMHDLVVSVEAVTNEGTRVEFKRDTEESVHPDMEILKARTLLLLEPEGHNYNGSCGYRLDSFAANSTDFVDLMVGSEGSLAIFTSATLRMVDRIDNMKCTLTGFESSGDAFAFAQRVRKEAICLEFLDSTATSSFQFASHAPRLPEKTRCSLAAIWRAAPPDGESAGKTVSIDADPMAMIEHLQDAMHRLQRPTQSGRYVVAAEGVEVPSTKLPDLMVAVAEISRRYALRCLIFGHAAEGILYVRPFLNLRKGDDRSKLKAFLGELASALKAEGGRVASENGIGLLMAAHARAVIGENRLKSFDLVKNSFDHIRIFGGVRASEDEYYRFGPEHDRKPFKPLLNWNTPDIIERFDERPISMVDEFDSCHGCGECRTLSFLETQCPVYKTTGSELTSPRGLNNLVRVLSNTGGVPTIAMYTEEYMRSIYDYCVQCKMCVAECPSHINTPKIIMETRAQHVKRLGVGSIGRVSRFFSDYELYTMIASSVASLSNRLMKSKNARSALEHSFGIDRRRMIPELDLEPFAEWFQKHVSKPGGKGEVAYFADVYANYFDSRIGRSVVGLLEKTGYTTRFPRQRFTGLPLIHLGMLREAKKYLLENISYLYTFAVRGLPILCSSPSSVMALRNDYMSVVDDERSRTVARNVADVHEFLLRALKTDAGDLQLKPVAGRIVYHPSCHSRALGTDRSVVELLKQIPGAEVEELQAGCCGAGGSYGFAKETFNLSMEIGRNVFKEAGRHMEAGTVVVTDGEECALQIEQATGSAPEMTLLLLAKAAGINLERTTTERRRK